MSIDTSLVEAAHDQMAEEYDLLDDLWYPWLFARIHDFIAARLRDERRRTNRALDAGCGTGFQTFLLAQAGYEVTGVDVSDSLLDEARGKIGRFAVPPLESPPLFTRSYTPAWLHRHTRRLATALERARGDRRVCRPHFIRADIREFDLGTGALDVICCCGSVLSFVEDYRAVLARMGHGLVGGGTLFLEVEQRYNLDLFWPAIDRMLAGRLAYDQTWREILHNVWASPKTSVRIDYPFDLRDGRSLVLPLWLFSVADLAEAFEAAGLTVVDRVGIHHATNLIPSTLLHKSKSPRWLGLAFESLRHPDEWLGRLWPFWRLGCSALYCLRRRQSREMR